MRKTAMYGNEGTKDKHRRGEQCQVHETIPSNDSQMVSVSLLCGRRLAFYKRDAALEKTDGDSLSCGNGSSFRTFRRVSSKAGLPRANRASPKVALKVPRA
jgi:hypothetical protein